jgi:hypothetical protein
MFNGELAQTNIDYTYKFNSFSPYIVNGGLNGLLNILPTEIKKLKSQSIMM